MSASEPALPSSQKDPGKAAEGPSQHVKLCPGKPRAGAQELRCGREEGGAARRRGAAAGGGIGPCLHPGFVGAVGGVCWGRGWELGSRGGFARCRDAKVLC